VATPPAGGAPAAAALSGRRDERAAPIVDTVIDVADALGATAGHVAIALGAAACHWSGRFPNPRMHARTDQLRDNSRRGSTSYSIAGRLLAGSTAVSTILSACPTTCSVDPRQLDAVTGANAAVMDFDRPLR
jgi:hypothetical protein